MRKPSPYTQEWWRRQFEGVAHSMHLLSAEVQSLSRRVAAAHDRLEQISKDHDELAAELGRQSLEMDALKVRLREKFESLEQERTPH